MVEFNNSDTLYHFIRIANCPKFNIEGKYIPLIFEKEFEEEYPDMVCDIFSELVIAYYQGYGY